MTARKGRAKARPLLFGVIAFSCVAVVSGCRSPLDRGGDDERTSGEPIPEFAEPASPLAGEPLPTTAPPATSPGGSTAQPAGAGGTTTTGAPAPVTTTPPDRTLTAVDDAPADHGIAAAEYADLRRVEYILAGDNLRVVVTVAAALPSRLATRETVGIGVDLFRSESTESDYQLFADGGLDGWRAFLQTPDGFVEYPGTFAIGGSRLVFEVPWTAVGGRNGFRTNVFADWSSREGLVPHSANDRAPDRGTVTVSPTAAS